MIFAQIRNTYVVNTFILDDYSLLDYFLNDPDDVPYDAVLQIDQIYPKPGIDWTFDGIIFIPPDGD